MSPADLDVVVVGLPSREAHRQWPRLVAMVVGRPNDADLIEALHSCAAMSFAAGVRAGRGAAGRDMPSLRPAPPWEPSTDQQRRIVAALYAALPKPGDQANPADIFIPEDRKRAPRITRRLPEFRWIPGLGNNRPAVIVRVGACTETPA